MKYITALIFFLFFFPSQALALENPLSVPNNKFGIHILFPEEIPQASALVNSNGGSWGYITIPVQSTDRDLVKWQKFMDQANTYKVIPIVRIATENYYFNTKVWRRPNESDIVDFANFLSSLEWPTKNRYVTVFNEVNRGDEWGGDPNPEEYAKILSVTAIEFKARSDDFFIISAGLDNASVTIPGQSINQFEYLRRMHQAVPEVFSQIDGLSSHSYPNPAFAKPPTIQDQMSIASFRFEKDLVKRLSGKDLPIFITETGWSTNKVSENLLTSYYEYAFTHVWNDEKVVAVTPFILFAGGEPFGQFSFLKNGTEPTENHKAFSRLPKSKGAPIFPKTVLSQRVIPTPKDSVKSFETKNNKEKDKSSQPAATILKWLLKI